MKTILNFANQFAANTSRIGFLQVMLGGFLISFTPVFVKISHTGPTADAFYRMTFGGIGLLIIALVRRERCFHSYRLSGIWLVAAICFACDLMFWHRSIEYIGPGLSSILINFQVFILVIFGVLFYKEKFNVWFFIAVFAALFGLCLVIGIHPSELGSQYQLGIMYAFVSATFYAIFTLFLRKSRTIAQPLPVFANLAMVSLLTGLVLFLIARVEGASLHLPEVYDWICLISYGLISQLFGWVLISQGLPKIHLSLAGLLLLIQPAFSFTWDMIFFQRPTTSTDIIGVIITLFALYLGFSCKNSSENRQKNEHIGVSGEGKIPAFIKK